MGKTLKIVFPPSFEKGVHCDVVVTINGTQNSKTLKVIRIGKTYVSFIEVDRPNRKNIFRKVYKRDISHIECITTASDVETVKKVFLIPDFLPSKVESPWSF